MTRPRGELTTYRAGGGHATDWANPTRFPVLKKTHTWTPFNVLIPLNDAFLFRIKENEILFGPPPPKKKAQWYERSRTWLHAHMFVYTSSLWPGFLLCHIEWFGALKLQSNSFIKIYHLIIVVFSRTRFSIYDIFYTNDTTQSFNARATQG